MRESSAKKTWRNDINLFKTNLRNCDLDIENILQADDGL